MKVMLLLGLGLLFTPFIYGEEANFMPQNTLWMDDRVDGESNVTKEMFMEIIRVGKSYYLPVAKSKSEKLSIKANWSDSTVNASASRIFGTVTINMYGGLARRPEITPDAFALVLCHELGHAYGGTPTANSLFKMAAEGQSDYYAAKICLKKVLTKVELHEESFETTEYMDQSCLDTHEDETSQDYKICQRILAAGQSVVNLFTTMTEKPQTDYETPDPLVVDKTEKSYPKTLQCRLDTYFAGCFNQDRPVCWWKPNGNEDEGVVPPEEGEEVPPEEGGDDNGGGDNPFPFPFPFPFPGGD